MKTLKKYYLISSFVISIFAFSYHSVYTQSLLEDNNNRITIYINPIDFSVYSKGNMLLNESNYSDEFELGISNKLNPILLTKRIAEKITDSKLHIGDLLEIDVSNQHNHYSPKLSSTEKFTIKCLLFLNFKISGVIEK